jgi:hypothetical protein
MTVQREDRRRRPALVFRGPRGIHLTIDGRLTVLIYTFGVVTGAGLTLWALGYCRV